MYRFVKVTTYYSSFLSATYGLHPGWKALGYEDQLTRLWSLRYGWSDYYRTHLRHHGVDAHEIIANARPLQDAWARSRSLSGSGGELLLRQMQELSPDVVFIQDMLYCGREWIRSLRERVPSVKLVIGWYCSPIADTVSAGYGECDLVMGCSPLFVGQMRDAGAKASLLPHAFEPSILDEAEPSTVEPAEVVFTGSFVPGTGFHRTRTDAIRSLIASGIPLTLYGNADNPSSVQLLVRRLGYGVGRTLDGLGLERFASGFASLRKTLSIQEFPRRLDGIDAIAERMRPAVYGLEMFRTLSRSKIALNFHGDVAGEYAANVRLFEATGAGSCLVTDHKKNLGEWFDTEAEVVTFRTPEECVEKVRWLLDHPTERAEIARRGHQRTLRDHTYAKRAEIVHEAILKEVG